MFNQLTGPVSGVLNQAASTDVTVPQGGSWPFWQTLAKFVGEIQFAGIVLCVLALIVGVIVWTFGKINSNGGMKNTGGTVMLIAIVAAMVIAAAPSIINWASNQQVV